MVRSGTALALLVALWAHDARAARAIELSQQVEVQPLTPYADVLVDSSRSLTIEQVAPSVEGFKPVEGSALALGYTSAAHWVRITLKSTSDAPTRWYLEAGYPLIHDVTFFVPKPEGGFLARQMGLSFPFSRRVVEVPTFVVPVELGPRAELTCYVRIAGDYSLSIPFTAYSEKGFNEQQSRRELLSGIYYGLVLVMILYNLLLYFSLRDRNYIHYVLTLIFLHLLYQLSFQGHYYQYLATDLTWWASRCLPFFVLLGTAFGVQFSRSFLHARELLPRWDKALAAVTWGSAALAPLSLVLPISVSDNLCITLGATASILLIIVGALAWRRGYAPARFYLMAWSSILVGDIIYTLKIAQVLPATFVTNHALEIGSALEVFLLSLALGDRINVLRREKESAQQAALEKQREAAEAQASLVEHLKRMDKLKDEILANTSHELRTPLNGISGLAESMLDGAAGPLPDKASKNLAMIVSSARRLTTLVNDILDFAKLKNEKLSLTVEPVDLREVAEAVVALSSALVGNKPLVLENQIPAGLPAVVADPNRLQQILHNLVGNAVKFTSQGSVVLSARAEAGHVEVSVTDTGIGIAPENQARIFEAFEQGDGSAAREYGGTGLGLAVTRKLVELQGGQLGVRSVVGKGSTFFFTLPCSDQPAAPRERTEKREQVHDPEGVVHVPAAPAIATAVQTLSTLPPAEAETPKVNGQVSGRAPEDCRILVVDDEPINQAVLANILTLQSYSIRQALNGIEALEALEKEEPFDLVLLDIMMPKMSGYEVCKKIRERFAISQLPILMLTAKTQVADLVEGFNAGANDYVTKPFSKRELLSRIRTHLQLAKMTTAAGRFVPYEFLSYLNKESLVDVRLGDQVRQDMTVLFSDIRSYTTLSEGMSPEENFRFLNGYFGAMAPVIQAQRGFIDKYIGDAIMALFDRSPRDAVAAAVEMQIKLRDFNGERMKSGQPMITAGVGINTGTLMLGTIGHAGRMQSTVISDAVNVAARLEALSKVFRSAIIISSETYRHCEGHGAFGCRCLGRVKVKGKTQPVAIYEVYDGYRPEVVELRRRTKADFEKGVEAWQRRDIAECNALMRRVVDVNPEDQAALLYLQRCATSGQPSSTGALADAAAVPEVGLLV